MPLGGVCVETKKCNSCGLIKDLKDFYLKRGIIPTSECKECIKKKRAEYVKNNYEKVLITNRKRYHRLKENNQWNGAKRYRENAFKDGLNGFLQTICRSCLRRRDGDITWKYLRELWDKQNGICALSGEKMTYFSGIGKIYTNVSVDRIDSHKGYFKDNVRLLCTGVNVMKLAMSDEEFINLIKKILCHWDEM